MVNATNFPAKELVHIFPINAPMSVLHIDGYSVGVSLNFAGDKGFLIAVCSMCNFAVAKPIDEPSARDYAQALVMIMFRFWHRPYHRVGR